ncbi:Aste57867_8387 [Aphanomyces stellatus]|uniref:Aste57867_8387 protein n=1 Tax=Aphanomyces stellatus TaxID=120398 RepID=A0A485KK46_9STRA|nr:hypothetical protein As57867_008355 [Aphanomyces stellatus]VFT85273.1 Aste57867_8387 [Aphanomyces stellatus]
MIQGIFYSEFDNIAGPQIVYQAPPNALSNEVFDSVSGYIIIDKALCGKIITVCPQDIKIVGYPVCIEDDKYHRNALLFNIGFVFHKDADAVPYKPILRKLGALMESMEKELCFLSKETTKATLATILPSILHDLTLYGESTITIDTSNIINLKVFHKLPPPPNVCDFQVPVAIRDLNDLLKNSVEWDLALQKIVPHIDGINYVKRISIVAEVEISIVKNCLRQLLYYGCITMIDIFLHSNMYSTTSKIYEFFNDPSLQQACVAYISRENDAPPSFSTVFALYCALQPNTPVGHVWNSHQKLLSQIDLRRFVTFGVIHGFLRRIHRYPATIDRISRSMTLSSSPSSMNVSSAALNNGGLPIRASLKTTPPQHGGVRSSLDKEKVKKMMDGEHHTDEICCTHMIRNSELEMLMANEAYCFVHK